MKLLKVVDADLFDIVEEQQVLEFDLEVGVGSSKFVLMGEMDIRQTADLDGVYVDKSVNELTWTIYNEEGDKINDFNIDLNYESVENVVREACQI